MTTEVTSTEFQQNVGQYSDAALKEPVIITSHNRARLVLMDVERYNVLNNLEKEAVIEDRINHHIDTLKDLADR